MTDIGMDDNSESLFSVYYEPKPCEIKLIGYEDVSNEKETDEE